MPLPPNFYVLFRSKGREDYHDQAHITGKSIFHGRQNGKGEHFVLKNIESNLSHINCRVWGYEGPMVLYQYFKESLVLELFSGT